MLTLQDLNPRGNELRIEIMSATKIKKSIKYADFHITNAASKYSLHANGFNSILADTMKRHNRQKISTFDSDNDSFSKKLCINVFWRLVVSRLL